MLRALLRLNDRRGAAAIGDADLAGGEARAAVEQIEVDGVIDRAAVADADRTAAEGRGVARQPRAGELLQPGPSGLA